MLREIHHDKETCESGKPNLCNKICHDGGTKQNMLKVHESEYMTYVKRSVMMEAQSKMCSRYVSRENLTHIRRSAMMETQSKMCLVSRRNPTCVGRSTMVET